MSENELPKIAEAKAEEKIDAETEETAAEIIERAETAVKRTKHGEAENAYRRAAKLLEGDEAAKLIALADKHHDMAKAKGQQTGQPKKKEGAAMATKKKEKKAKAPKSVAKKAKAPKAAKPKKEAKKPGDPKHHYPSTPAEKRDAAERTAAFKKASAKRDEPNDKEKLVLTAFGGVGKEKTIGELGEKAWPNKPKAIQKSWARNSLRWIVNSKQAKKIDRGTYRRIA
jgi:hypothetical protein